MAGLFYFAAWYTLVYAGVPHLSEIIREEMTLTGSDADRLLLKAIRLSEEDGKVQVASYNRNTLLNALNITFGQLLPPYTLVCFVELYGAGLQLQLPFAKVLGRIPGNLKNALESRDDWLATSREMADQPKVQATASGTSEAYAGEEAAEGEVRPVAIVTSSSPFMYLGPIDHHTQSTLAGLMKRAPVARAVDALDDEAYSLWYGTVTWVEDLNRIQNPDNICALLAKSLDSQLNLEGRSQP